MAIKKKPTAKQLAARAKFIKMVRAKAKAKKGIHTLGAVKKKAPKKVAAKSYHKDTKSHNVKIHVVSGVKPKPTVLLLAKKIQKDTHYNDHTEAVLRLAKFLRDKEMITLLNAIKKAHKKHGSLPSAYQTARDYSLRQLLEKAKMKLPGADYEALRKSF